MDNLVLWVSLSGVLTMLNSLSFFIPAPFLLDPALCTPLAYAATMFTYSTTRLGILYAQVRVVRRSTDPTTYTTLSTLAMMWWRKLVRPTPRSSVEMNDLAAAAAPNVIGVGVGVGADGVDVTFDDPFGTSNGTSRAFVGEMDTMATVSVSAAPVVLVDGAARAPHEGRGGGGGGGVSGGTIVSIEEEEGPHDSGGEDP